MPIDITMPALSPTMEEGNLAKWLVKEGDKVEPGDVIAEIETDKATMEVEAVDEGTIAKIHVAAGTDGVKVNQVIAVLAEDGEDVSAAASSAPEAAPKGATTSKQETKSEKAEPTTQPAETISAAQTNGDRIIASPLARRIAEQNNIDLAAIKGSGPRGRIVKADVEGKSNISSVPSSQSATTTLAAPIATSMSDEQVLAFYKEDEYEVLPHDGMRRTIASRLTESTQTIPSYNISMDCQLDALLALRKQINEAAPTGDDEKPLYKVSVNDFIIKAMALGLRDVPMANASWTSGARILHKHSDVGVAVAIPDGLITPIVKRAEEKSLSVISIEMKDLAGRAREKKLKPQEYQGGSTAVSNLGMFGVSNFTSIINPPHASIVSIGAGTKQPVVKDGELVPATVMTATFAFDHRVIDGALGAELAVAFKHYIESPIGMLV
ncbi:MAG: pyruvate dehydrogenase complex dihydrolipoamide acetyltransferase [Rhizobiaceae bacterium]|nr:pyruvate dehydrogenase complex dihydrolipoamide acetyltransferase [Rhizobiaceae bacterium]